MPKMIATAVLGLILIASPAFAQQDYERKLLEQAMANTAEEARSEIAKYAETLIYIEEVRCPLLAVESDQEACRRDVASVNNTLGSTLLKYALLERMIVQKASWRRIKPLSDEYVALLIRGANEYGSARNKWLVGGR